METKPIRWWIFWPILIGIALFSYANQLIYRYQVPPGGDAIVHNQVVDVILSGNLAPLWHSHSIWAGTIALLFRLSHVPSITLMAWLGPLLLVSGAATLYFFNRKYFGPIAGITTMLLIGFFSRQPLQTLYDGGFPNVLAALTVLPLTLIALESAIAAPRQLWRWPLALLALIGLTYSHHLTTLYALVIIATYLITLALIWLSRRRWAILTSVLAVPVLYLAVIVAVNLFFRLGHGSAQSLAALFVRADWQWPFIHLIGKLDNPNAILGVLTYPNLIGEAIAYLSAGGVIVAVGYFLKNSQSRQGRVSLLLMIWLTLLFVGSQTPALGFPVRLARDLVVPMVLLAGIFLQAITDFCRNRGLPLFLLVIIFLLSFGLGYEALRVRIQTAFSPNPLVYYLPADNRMTSWVEANLPKQSVIAIFPGDAYLPLFLPNQVVLLDIPAAIKQKMTDPNQVATVLPKAQYVYFHYRLDQPFDGFNNPSNLQSYLMSQAVTVVHQESQPEELVYLFKVKPKATKR